MPARDNRVQSARLVPPDRLDRRVRPAPPGPQGPAGPQGTAAPTPTVAPAPQRDINADWAKSAHGDKEAAARLASVESRAAGAAHCGRCHSGQGFIAWHTGDLTKQIPGAAGNATVDELRALGMTRASVKPIDCDTCHGQPRQGATPSTSGMPLRINGNTPPLPAGFTVTNAGSGALCMTCHNTRNGARGDGITPPSFSAPHTAAQADVLMGRNAYFVTTPDRSSHGLLKDTCVTCHMTGTPVPTEITAKTPRTDHVFKASTQVCGSCHSSVFDAKSFQHEIEERVHKLGDAMSEYLMRKIGAQVTVKDYAPHNYQGKSYDLKSDPILLEKSNIASIEATEPHGQIGCFFNLKSPVNVTYKPANEAAHTMSVNKLEVQLGDVSGDGKTSLLTTTDPLVKVGWNFFLIEGDGSWGVHNPDFTREVLNASIKALK